MTGWRVTKWLRGGLCGSLAIFAAGSPARAETPPSFTEQYPDLKKFIPTERTPDLFFGFGVSPLTLVNNKIGLSVSLFEVHWLRGLWDLELFNASFGTVFGGTYGAEQIFTLRTAPKLRLFKNFSIGPLAGAEFVHFSNVSEQLNKNGLYAPTETFSAVGAIYGGILSETFAAGKGSLIRVNEAFYRETYSATGTSQGWTYQYAQSALNSDVSPISASTVFALEISYLY